MKSFVWYSPSEFEENGWEVPETWDDMVALSDEMADAGVKPWCAGIESGDATGWPTTDWLEDVILRDAGPDVYDQWVNHEIPFNDPAIVEALDRVGGILKNDDYVNGGIGDVKSIATTAFQEGGLPILDGECGLHRQASLLRRAVARGHRRVRERRRVRLLPADHQRRVRHPGPRRWRVRGGVLATSRRSRRSRPTCPPTCGPTRRPSRRRGGWVSANNGLDIANLTSPIDKLSAEILQDPEAVFRFDGSDQMPGAVGAGSFWTEMTAWITGAEHAGHPRQHRGLLAELTSVNGALGPGPGAPFPLSPDPGGPDDIH